MKIKIVDQKFYHGKNTMVCKLKCAVIFEEEPTLRCQEKFSKRFPDFHMSWLGCNFEVSGKSKCCPTDTYNPLTAKRLSEARAFKKVYKYGKQISSFFKDYYERLTDEFSDSLFKYEDLIDEEDLNIDNLTWNNNGDNSSSGLETAK